MYIKPLAHMYITHSVYMYVCMYIICMNVSVLYMLIHLDSENVAPFPGVSPQKQGTGSDGNLGGAWERG